MLQAVEIVVVAAIVFAVAATSVGRFDRLSPAPPDSVGGDLPASAVSARDVVAVRFDMALRGYRMAEVDAVLARLADELAWRDAELARKSEELARLVASACPDHQTDGGGSAGYPGADPGDRSDPDHGVPGGGAPGAAGVVEGPSSV